MNNFNICVFCSSQNGNEPAYKNCAIQLGKAIALQNYTLIFGGGNTGLMGSVSQATVENGGKAIGIIPEILISKEPPAKNLSQLILTKTMAERKQKMMELADAFIALPGGLGTLDEAFEVLTDNHIGIFNKPFSFLDVNGYWQPLLNFLKNSNKKLFISDRSLKNILYFTSVQETLQEIGNLLSIRLHQ